MYAKIERPLELMVILALYCYTKDAQKYLNTMTCNTPVLLRVNHYEQFEWFFVSIYRVGQKPDCFLKVCNSRIG